MIILDALAWILNGSHWGGSAGRGDVAILQRLGETMQLSLISALIAIVIATPIGVLIGHTGRGRQVAVLVSNVARALPTLGLLSILILAIAVNATPVVVVLVVLGIPPMLAGAYAGIGAVPRETIDAARAMGMHEIQIVLRVEVPLAASLLVGGLRSTVLQIVATTTVAAFFLPVGLGAYLSDGLAQRDYVQMLGGGVLVTVLCLVIDGVLAVVQRLVAPRGAAHVPASTSRRVRTARADAAAGIPSHQES